MSALNHETTSAPAEHRAPARLLAAAGRGRARSLAEHRGTYAPPPQPVGVTLTEIIDAVRDAGLRGRGGAGFPTATKLAAVAAGNDRPVVVVNGSEGEPTSHKDKLLLATAPHLVLDGAVIAAAAVGATEVTVCLERSSRAAAAAVRAAIAERERSEHTIPISVATIPSRYVAGEERSLVNFLNDGPAKPTAGPLRPFQRGVGGRPTLVNNVETLAHLAQIVQFGPEWFRGVGRADDPGTALISLSGAVARPGVYEIPTGMALERLLTAAGGVTAPISAFLLGGYYGSWIAGRDAAVPLGRAELGALGAGLGCGAIVALSEAACGWTETARVLAWMAEQSAGQCGPCVHGLRAIADAAIELAVGRGSARTVADLHRWAGQVEGRGACRFPDGAVRLLRSALATFAPELDRHCRQLGCHAAHLPFVLPIPELTVESSEWR